MLIAKEKYFVDTNAWVALYDKKDQYHSQASKFLKELLGKPITLITSDYIMDFLTKVKVTIDIAKEQIFFQS